MTITTTTKGWTKIFEVVEAVTMDYSLGEEGLDGNDDDEMDVFKV